MVIPYVQGLGESFKHIYARYGIKVYFKGNRTLKQLLVQPKDKDPKEKFSWVIYHYQCPAIKCGEEYIHETSRTLGEQCREHMREPSPIQAHKERTGHLTTNTMQNFNILFREGQDLTRLIKEAIFIRVNNPTLNKNIGRFQLSHIWDRVLFNIPNLKAAFTQGNVQHSP